MKRLEIEFRWKPYFSLNEPDGIIDLRKSFISSFISLRTTIVIRAVILLWSSISIIIGAFTDDDVYFFLAYLTNWTALMSLGYQSTALAVSINHRALSQTKSDYQPQSNLLKAMWVLYSIAAPAATLIIFLFWILDYEYSKDGPVTYCMVFEHGVLSALILLDGNILGRIPMRLKHFLLFLSYALSYLVWTLIFAFVGKGETPIYDVLDWRNDIGTAAVVSTVVILLLCPFIFVLCWLLSLPKRRMVQNQINDLDGFIKPNPVT